MRRLSRCSPKTPTSRVCWRSCCSSTPGAPPPCARRATAAARRPGPHAVGPARDKRRDHARARRCCADRPVASHPWRRSTPCTPKCRRGRAPTGVGWSRSTRPTRPDLAVTGGGAQPCGRRRTRQRPRGRACGTRCSHRRTATSWPRLPGRRLFAAVPLVARQHAVPLPYAACVPVSLDLHGRALCPIGCGHQQVYRPARTGAVGSWARPPSPARGGGCGSPHGRPRPSRTTASASWRSA